MTAKVVRFEPTAGLRLPLSCPSTKHGIYGTMETSGIPYCPVEHSAMSTETKNGTLTGELAVGYARLTRLYNLVDPAEVRSFLAGHPTLVPLLLDLYPLVVQEFSEVHISLRVLRDTEVNSASGHLLVQVSTPITPLERVGQLDRRVESLLLAADPAALQWLLIDVPTSLEREDVVQLVERYRQRFSDGYRLQLDTARRFLTAAADSDERALAGADLSAALAREQAVAVPGRGGDAREVLARLRQRRQDKDRLTGAD